MDSIRKAVEVLPLVPVIPTDSSELDFRSWRRPLQALASILYLNHGPAKALGAGPRKKDRGSPTGFGLFDETISIGLCSRG
jgi:hypothetical protein